MHDLSQASAGIAEDIVEQDLRASQEALDAIEAITNPAVAAINGCAMGRVFN